MRGGEDIYYSEEREKQYYKMHVDNVIEELETSAESGLDTREANKRLRRVGSNLIADKSKRNIFSIFLDQFRDFMIIVLISAAVISFFMGETADSIVIFSIVVLNAIMGFVQEYKAERALEELKRMAAPLARVVRSGDIYREKPEVLVPGDIIVLSTGDKIPADARIIESSNLEVDQSILTGESNPVKKDVEMLYGKNITSADRKNILFMGAIITRGKARAVVVRTGSQTEMGRIADLIEDKEVGLTPLQKRLKHLGYWLVMLSIGITLAIVVIGIFKGHSFYQMLLAGISLAVAAIPEGLPAIVTLVLAFGVQKMIKKNAVVRKLHAVETLGSTTVICSDKTGTLTKNMMNLEKVFYNNQIRKFTGKTKQSELTKLLSIGALCNSSEVSRSQKDGPIKKIKDVIIGKTPPPLIGDPTDIALKKAIYNYNYSLEKLKENYEVLAVEEFDSSKKRMSALVKIDRDSEELWIKGAPEVILDRCETVFSNGKSSKLDKKKKQEIKEACDSMAKDALRVLAIAYRILPDKIKDDDMDKYENKLTFVGLVGLMDPPRDEAKEAVIRCHTAGIRPVMVTGDHSLTAKVIARKVGIIGKYDQVVDGTELSNISDRQFNILVKNRKVFARIVPEDKLKIIEVFQKTGEVVAMTGDGVNDAPALKKADIGIAMGKSGSDVAKEVSSLILTDDNFATIVAAIEEGRKIYNNIRKFIKYLLSCNIGELLTIFFGVTLGLPLPLIPIQILWVNLVTDGLPALALGIEDEDDLVMEMPPRAPDESIFAGGMLSRILSQGFLIGISTTIIYLYAIFRMNTGVELARTMAFSTLVFSQLFFVFSCRSDKKPFWWINPFSNIFLVLAVIISALMQLIVIYNPYLAEFFGTAVLDLNQWIWVLVMSCWSTVFLEIFFKFKK